MIEGAPFLVEYQRRGGTLAIDRINDDLQGTTEQYRRGWLVNQSFNECLYLSSGDFCVLSFCYEPTTINVPENNPIFLLYRPQVKGSELTPIWLGDWKFDWKMIKPFYLNGSTYLLSYSPALVLGDATAAIDKVASDGKGTTEVWRTEDWSNDWEFIEPFYMNGNTYVMYFATSTGIVFDQVNANGQGTTELYRSSQLYNAMILKIFYNGGKTYVLMYYSSSRWEIYQIRDDLQGLTFVVQGKWGVPTTLLRSPWYAIEPFYKGNDVYFFASDAVPLSGASGCTVGIGQFDPGGKTINSLWNGEWSGDWTDVKPFYAPPKPYPPIIPG